MLTFVCATANLHKALELEEILRGLGSFTLLPRPADLASIEEDGLTFEDNAILKASAVCSATNRASIADDSGLEVDALSGQPGVFSARYAGEGASDAENRQKLLLELKGVTHRSARFVAAVAVAFPDGVILVVEGAVEGSIAEADSGEGGFGYDSLFIPSEGDGRTFAAMSAQEKNELSHRGRALASMVEALAHAGRR
ncbi:MAG: RdgB/HAM1 family non-canonical purine NTP pyrophosphatase [Actinomycetota bacterium]